MPAAGTGTVAENLRLFIDRGLAVLVQLTPAFAGLLSQPKVLSRFHAMVGGDAAFGAATTDDSAATGDGENAGGGEDAPGGGETPGAGRRADHDPGGHDPGEGDAERRGLPELLTRYLRAEQELGRIGPAADVEAAATLIVGAMHGQVLPRVLFEPARHHDHHPARPLRPAGGDDSRRHRAGRPWRVAPFTSGKSPG